MRTETRRRVEDTGSVFFSDDDVNDALNEGYELLSDASEWFETSITVDVLSTRPYYDLRRIFPYQVLAPGAAFNPQTNRWLMPSSITDLDRMWRRPEQVYTQPERIVNRSLFWVMYWPLLTTEGSATVTQYAICMPSRLGNDDEPGFPERFHRGCVAYALTVLFPQKGETQKAREADLEYQEEEAELCAWKAGRVGTPMMRSYGADAR